MFFIQKWQHFLSKHDMPRLVKEKNAQSVTDIVDIIFTNEDKTKSDYNIFDHRYKNKHTTVLQRLNLLWFSIVFLLVIYPLRYLFKGEPRFDERTPAGKFVTRLIGEEVVHKAFGYKGGWQKTLDKKEFLVLLSKNNVQTVEDFISFMFSEEDSRWEDYLIVDNKQKNTEATFVQRLNLLWVLPVLLVIVTPVKLVAYIKTGSFQVRLPNKVKRFLNYLLGWKEIE